MKTEILIITETPPHTPIPALLRPPPLGTQ